jgi:tetratricopeptide (TPR) repeat protein
VVARDTGREDAWALVAIAPGVEVARAPDPPLDPGSRLHGGRYEILSGQLQDAAQLYEAASLVELASRAQESVWAVGVGRIERYDAAIWLARRADDLGDLEGAAHWFRAAAETMPPWRSGALAELGRLYLAKGQPAAAVSTLRDATEQTGDAADPNLPRYRLALAGALAQAGEADEASRIYAGLVTSPDGLTAAEAAIWLGNWERAQARSDDAVAAFGTAAERFPAWAPRAFAEIARTRVAEGRPIEAARAYDRSLAAPALADDPAAATYVRELAGILAAQGDFAGTRTAFERLESFPASGPDAFEGFLWLGDDARDRGEPERAARMFEAAARAVPAWATRARVEAARTWRDRGDLARAVGTYESALREVSDANDPQIGAYVDELLGLYSRTDQGERRIAFDRSFVSSPVVGVVAFNACVRLASEARDAGDYAGAATWYELAAGKMPVWSTRALVEAGRLRAMAGDDLAAKGNYERALNPVSDPGDPEVPRYAQELARLQPRAAAQGSLWGRLRALIPR